MEISSWLLMGLGTVIVLAVLVDVLLAVLHVNRSGVMAPRVHRLVWASAMRIAPRHGRARRNVLAFAGPAMVTTGFVFWVALFILGFALIYWPNLEHYRAEDAFTEMGFMDALYYSGVTATVLGYGDITPLRPGLKILAFVQSGLGFGLLTGIVTYLISVVNGVTERNVIALRVHSATHDTDDGVHAVLRSLERESVSETRARLDALVVHLHEFQEQMRKLPVLYLFYRSDERRHDPESFLQVIVEIAIAALLLGHGTRYARLLTSAEDVTQAAAEVMELTATEHLGATTLAQVREAQVEDVDRHWAENIAQRLRACLGDAPVATPARVPPALRIATQGRLVLEGLEPRTGWYHDHPRRYRQTGVQP